mgnify:FL=1
MELLLTNHFFVNQFSGNLSIESRTLETASLSSLPVFAVCAMFQSVDCICYVSGHRDDQTGGD